LAIKASELKNEFRSNFSEIALTPITDATKLSIDLFYDIIEADFQYKEESKNYVITTKETITLFDETK